MQKRVVENTYRRSGKHTKTHTCSTSGVSIRICSCCRAVLLLYTTRPIFGKQRIDHACCQSCSSDRLSLPFSMMMMMMRLLQLSALRLSQLSAVELLLQLQLLPRQRRLLFSEILPSLRPFPPTRSPRRYHQCSRVDCATHSSPPRRRRAVGKRRENRVTVNVRRRRRRRRRRSNCKRRRTSP